MNQEKNILIKGSDDRPISLDIFAPEDPSPVVIYAHGFSGFKDWGNFDLIAQEFASNGFCFVKFNFSHNGTTPEAPEDFVDLEAFGNNNISRELFDLGQVIDWVAGNSHPFLENMDRKNIFLIGHSMGGGVVLIKASEEKRVRAVVTWASIAESKTPWGKWSEEKIGEWKKTGVAYYLNGRTNQQLPLYYQLYEDHFMNEEKHNILRAASSLLIPLLIIHGTEDEAVSTGAAYAIHEKAALSEIFTLTTDHVFGRKHPWTENYLPPATKEVVAKSIAFLKRLLNNKEKD
jgi:uncharacterized protein